MITKRFRYLLREEDWIDVRITTTEDNNIVRFSVNYTAIIEDKAYPVIRYDNAHGFAHIDRLWLDPEKRKEEIKGLSNIDILKIARKDITDNWKKYRKKMEKIIRGEKNEGD